MYTEYKYCFVVSPSTPSQAFLLRQEQENQDQIARDLQQRLEEVIAQSEQANKKPEPITEHDSGENVFDLLSTTAAEVVEQEASESDESEVSE